MCPRVRRMLTVLGSRCSRAGLRGVRCRQLSARSGARRGAQTRPGARGPNDNRRRLPQRGFPPVPPRRGRLAKAGPVCVRTRTGRRQAGREDSAPLRTVPACRDGCGAGRGRALSSRPALGEGPGYGLRLRTSRTRGAAAPRVRRGIGSTVNCTLDGQRQHRFQALWCPERPCWRLRPPFGAGGRPPSSPERATRR